MATDAHPEGQRQDSVSRRAQAWFRQHEEFLNERTINEETGSSSHYTHKTLRSAYLSLKRNLDYLFTFEAILSWAYATPPICWMDALPT